MKFITSRTSFAVLAGVITTLIIFSILSFSKNTVELTNEESKTNKFYLSTSTIPLLVSGVVEAADSVTVYAETSGVITVLPVKEGKSVAFGAVVSQQKLPVAEAGVYLAEAQTGLTYLQQAAVVTESELLNKQAVARTYSANEIASLRFNSNNQRIIETKNLLLNNLEKSAVTAISIIDYVNNHRFIFDAEGLGVYDEVLANIYGSAPKYFINGKQYAVKSSIDIISVLEELKSNPEISVLEVQTLSKQIEEQLKNLAYLFTKAEADVFNRQSKVVTDDIKTEYLAIRNQVLETNQDLQTISASTQKIIDQVLEEAVVQKTNVTVTESDGEIALAQAEYSKKIAEQSVVVAQANSLLAHAQQSLGVIKAPFAGTVTKLFATVGEYVTPGSPILKIVGSGARELKVSVPSYLLPQINKGQALVVGGKTVGFVDRFSDITEGGSGEVIISLLTEDLIVGSSLSGNLEITAVAGVYKIPRSYLHFSVAGPYIDYEDGSQSDLKIIYDSGDEVFIKPTDFKELPLLPVSSVIFK